MNISVDKETRIVGLGLTPEEAMSDMLFYVERSGRLSTEHLKRKKEIHTWIPNRQLIHVKGVGAVLYNGGVFENLRTGRRVALINKPLSHYLGLYNAFDGLLSFEDFTLTLGAEVDRYLSGIYGGVGTVRDFPYIKPVEKLDIRHYHATTLSNVSVLETESGTIVVTDGERMREVDKVPGVSTDCILAYLFASMQIGYDGRSLRRYEN